MSTLTLTSLCPLSVCPSSQVSQQEEGEWEIIHLCIALPRSGGRERDAIGRSP